MTPRTFLNGFGLCLGHCSTYLLHDELASAPDGQRAAPYCGIPPDYKRPWAYEGLCWIGPVMPLSLRQRQSSFPVACPWLLAHRSGPSAARFRHAMRCSSTQQHPNPAMVDGMRFRKIRNSMTKRVRGAGRTAAPLLSHPRAAEAGFVHGRELDRNQLGHIERHCCFLRTGYNRG
jgi:hypothetical protein